MFGRETNWIEDIVDMIEYYISIFFDLILCKRSVESREPNNIRNPIHSPSFEADQVYPCKENF
jgi:hypothetical protein